MNADATDGLGCIRSAGGSHICTCVSGSTTTTLSKILKFENFQYATIAGQTQTNCKYSDAFRLNAQNSWRTVDTIVMQVFGAATAKFKDTVGDRGWEDRYWGQPAVYAGGICTTDCYYQRLRVCADNGDLSGEVEIKFLMSTTASGFPPSEGGFDTAFISDTLISSLADQIPSSWNVENYGQP
jgi:predicted nucleic-acid-binding Zn-ribbon protein